jgi:hypothetical protein
VVHGDTLSVPEKLSENFVTVRGFLPWRLALFYRLMKIGPLHIWLAFFATTAGAQIQIDIKFKRFQYIAYEPLMATVSITNLAGREVDLRDAAGQAWFGPSASILIHFFPCMSSAPTMFALTFILPIWINSSIRKPKSSRSLERVQFGRKLWEYRMAPARATRGRIRF